jgi:hypothetical protein
VAAILEEEQDDNNPQIFFRKGKNDFSIDSCETTFTRAMEENDIFFS